MVETEKQLFKRFIDLNLKNKLRHTDCTAEKGSLMMFIDIFQKMTFLVFSQLKIEKFKNFQFS